MGRVETIRIFTVAMVLLAAPANVRAQTPLLTAGRSALMIQGGADISSIEQRAGDTELLKFASGEPWGAVTGMWGAGPRTSLLFGVSFASAGGRVENPGRFVVLPGTAYYPKWDQSGYTIRIQAGTIIWFK